MMRYLKETLGLSTQEVWKLQLELGKRNEIISKRSYSESVWDKNYTEQDPDQTLIFQESAINNLSEEDKAKIEEVIHKNLETREGLAELLAPSCPPQLLDDTYPLDPETIAKHLFPKRFLGLE
jgi:hypothetical protein